MATRTSNKQDSRKPNFQPNHLPAAIEVVVSYAGAVLATIAAVQNKKLSEAGNICFNAGFASGWQLPGTWDTVLAQLSFAARPANIVAGPDGKPAVEGIGSLTDLAPSSKGVHLDTNGRPMVYHSGVVQMPSAEGDPVARRVTAEPYWNAAKSSFGLKVQAVPPMETSAGTVRGILSEGFTGVKVAA